MRASEEALPQPSLKRGGPQRRGGGAREAQELHRLGGHHGAEGLGARQRERLQRAQHVPLCRLKCDVRHRYPSGPKRLREFRPKMAEARLEDAQVIDRRLSVCVNRSPVVAGRRLTVGGRRRSSIGRRAFVGRPSSGVAGGRRSFPVVGRRRRTKRPALPPCLPMRRPAQQGGKDERLSWSKDTRLQRSFHGPKWRPSNAWEIIRGKPLSMRIVTTWDFLQLAVGGRKTLADAPSAPPCLPVSQDRRHHEDHG